VAGLGGDFDGVVLAVQAAGGRVDVPVGHFSGAVAAFAGAAAVGVYGQAAVGEALDMVDMTDRCVTVRISAASIPQLDQLLEESVEVAAQRGTTDDRSTQWGGVQAAPP
jgi:hypothetical protein